MNIEKLNWSKVNNLLPVIVQDAKTLQVLMLGYMTQAALEQTLRTQKVTFFSRTKNKLWVKGETSGNFLKLVNIISDCDNDTLLIQAIPEGPCCHLQHASCFGEDEAPGIGFLAKLENTIEQRFQERAGNSYTSRLFEKGNKRIAQKVGEEGVEVALAAVTGDREELINEAADLIYHLLVLLKQNNSDFLAIISALRQRHNEKIDE